jgi:hypothetical protein
VKVGGIFGLKVAGSSVTSGVYHHNDMEDGDYKSAKFAPYEEKKEGITNNRVYMVHILVITNSMTA